MLVRLAGAPVGRLRGACAGYSGAGLHALPDTWQERPLPAVERQVGVGPVLEPMPLLSSTKTGTLNQS